MSCAPPRQWARWTGGAGCAGIALAVAACGADPEGGVSSSDDATVGATDVPGVPTWNGDVGPLVGALCGDCHRPDGSGRFSLVEASDWALWGAAALNAIDEGRMPPWLPDPSCRPVADARVVAPSDRARIRAWYEAGMPLGSPSDAVEIAAPAQTINANLRVRLPEAYTPDISDGDDYRCFVLDLPRATDLHVTGAAIVPGTPQVHHATLFALSGEHAVEAKARDAADVAPGFSCFGGPVNLAHWAAPADLTDPEALVARLRSPRELPTVLASWTDGALADVAPPGSAAPISANAQLVLQVHYRAQGGVSVRDAATEVALQTVASPLPLLRRSRFVANPAIAAEADQPSAVSARSVAYWGGQPLIVRGVMAQMHHLGRSISLDALPADSDTACVLHIEHWHFDWEWPHTFAPGHELRLQPGDRLELTCEYDNSAAHQPVISGQQASPRDIGWGDGADDERCLVVLDTLSPVDAASVGSGSCCLGGDPRCTCGAATSRELACQLGSLRDCGSPCAQTLTAAPECLAQCLDSAEMLGASFEACMRATCDAAWDALEVCIDAALQRPECSSSVVRCAN